MKRDNVYAIIPARGGSKGLYKKNLAILAGEPLIAHTIRHIKLSNCTDVYVSTDCNEIAEVSREYGAKVINRPSEISEDLSTTETALKHAASEIKGIHSIVSAFVYVSCSQPIRDTTWINQCIDKVLIDGYDSAFVGYMSHKNYWVENDNKYDIIWREPYSNRQTRKIILEENTGTVCVSRANIFLRGDRVGTNVYVLPVDSPNIDIHDDVDLYIAEKFYERYKSI